MKSWRSVLAFPFLLATITAEVAACSSDASPATAATAADADADADAAAPATGDGAAVTPCPPETTPPACSGKAVTVSTADALYTAIMSVTEFSDETVQPSSGAALQPSREFKVTAALELTAAQVRSEAALCEEDAGVTCVEATFTPEKPFHTSMNPLAGYRLGAAYPAGVTCKTPSDDGGDCAVLAIAAGTSLRFQRVVEHFYFSHTETHYVRVVRPCETLCALGEIRCAASTTCMASGAVTCVLCDGKDDSTCACRAGCGAISESAPCTYADSDDTELLGTCKSGACTK